MSTPNEIPSVNFCILGNQKAALEFGKAGTSSDITIYDKKARDAIRTWVVPSGFPEKIPPLFQAILMSEHVIFYADALDRFAGEQIIALDILGKKNGILCHTYDVDEARLGLMIKGTVVENYTRVGINELADAVNAIKSAPDINNNKTGKSAQVVIDHSFDVKGVGTVILGRVTTGTIKQYDTLIHHPAGSEVLIKSIQMHDDSTNAASYPARVGLAVKGVKPDDIQRGDILSHAQDGAVISSQTMKLNYVPNRFYKGDVSKNQGCMVSVGLQTRAAIIAESATNDSNECITLELKFAKPVVFHAGDTAVLLKPEAAPVRIVGSGRIV